MILLKQVNLSA